MSLPEKRIVDFLSQHHVLTLAVSTDDHFPWCANCFYAYLENLNAFVFTSDEDTRHVQYALQQNKVAGSVVLETNIVGKIQGLQFRGILEKASGAVGDQAKNAYLKRFPYAVLMKTNLWILSLTYIKMTDNRLGFGKKLIWEQTTDTTK